MILQLKIVIENKRQSMKKLVFRICWILQEKKNTAQREIKYMQGGEGFLIVFAINSRDSFDEVTIRDQVLRVKDADKVPMVICGTNAIWTMKEKSPKLKEKILQNPLGVPFFECSSRINIKESFYQLVRNETKQKQ